MGFQVSARAMKSCVFSTSAMSFVHLLTTARKRFTAIANSASRCSAVEDGCGVECGLKFDFSIERNRLFLGRE